VNAWQPVISRNKPHQIAKYLTLAGCLFYSALGSSPNLQPVVLVCIAIHKHVQFLQAPTIVAWDPGGVRRILAIEARGPRIVKRSMS
jgi:hypothetical protein